MLITRKQLHSDLAKVSREFSSEHSKFSTGNPPVMSHVKIFPPYKTEKLVAGLNKMNLDLLKHPTANELVNLPHKNVDDLAGGMAEQYTKCKNTETKELRKMKEDVERLKAKSKELNKDKKRLRKKLNYTRQELDHTRQELD